MKKFQRMGYEWVKEEHIVTSASASADHCRQQGYKRAFVVGEVGLREELQMQGIEVLWDEGCSGMSDEQFLKVAQDIERAPPVDVVVVGWDKNFSYRKICMASIYMQRGAKLVVTNPDSADRIGGYLMPGNGCNAEAILCSLQGQVTENSLSHHEEAAVCGKPSQHLMDALLEKYQFKGRDTLMCGDRLDTDIEFGGGKVSTLLVLSGVSTEAHIKAIPPSAVIPDHVAMNVFEAVIAGNVTPVPE